MWQKMCIFVTWKIHSRYAHTDAWSWPSSTVPTSSPRRHGRNWRSGSTTIHTWTRNWPCWAKPPAPAPTHRRRSEQSWRRWENRRRGAPRHRTTEIKPVHPWNILPILVTLDVSKLPKLINLRLLHPSKFRTYYNKSAELERNYHNYHNYPRNNTLTFYLS